MRCAPARAAFPAAAAALTALLVAALAVRPHIGAPLTAIALIGLVLALRPHWSIFMAAFAATAALPQSVPFLLPAGPVQIYLYEPLLYIAVVYAFTRGAAPLHMRRAGGFLLGVIVLYTTVGWASGFGRREIIFDLRGPFVMLCFAYIVSVMLMLRDETLIRGAMRMLRFTLWWSAVAVLLASATGLRLQGRQEAASLANAASVDGPTRYLTNATHLALAVLCGVLGALFLGRIRFKTAFPFLIPAVTLVFLSFSRNSVIALAVALVAAVLAGRTAKDSMVILGKTLFASICIVLFLAFGQALAGIPGLGIVQSEGRAYVDRVLAGFSATAITNDGSAQYRIAENRALRDQLSEHPLAGVGFGFPYKEGFGPQDSFTGYYGRYYAHDFYLWIWLKCGLLGFIGFLLFAFRPLFRRADDSAGSVGLIAAGAALLVVSVVAPLPLGQADGGAAAIGLTLGALVGQRARQTRSATFLDPPAAPEQTRSSVLALAQPASDFRTGAS